MKKLVMIFPVLLMAVLFGCSQGGYEEKLLGTWNMSMYVSASEMAAMSEEAVPNGMSMEMTASGSQTFHVGGKYSGNGEFTLRIKQGADEVALRFMIRDAGTWEIHDDILLETSNDSVVTPLDDLTKNVVAQTPELQNMIAPVSGESASIKILHISGSVAELEMLGPPKMSVTLKRP